MGKVKCQTMDLSKKKIRKWLRSATGQSKSVRVFSFIGRSEESVNSDDGCEMHNSVPYGDSSQYDDGRHSFHVFGTILDKKKRKRIYFSFECSNRKQTVGGL